MTVKESFNVVGLSTTFGNPLWKETSIAEPAVSSSHLTPRWRERDSNPLPVARLQVFCGFRHPREDQSGLHTGSLLDARQHGLTASRPREYNSKSAAHFEGHPRIPWRRISAPRRRVPLNQELCKKIRALIQNGFSFA